MNEKANETIVDIVNEMYDCDGVVKAFAERLDTSYSRSRYMIINAMASIIEALGQESLDAIRRGEKEQER